MTPKHIESIARIVDRNYGPNYPDMPATGDLTRAVAEAMNIPSNATIIVTPDASMEIQWQLPNDLTATIKVWSGFVPEGER